MVSLSLSATLSPHPCFSPHRLPNFLSHHIFPFFLFLALISIHSRQSYLSKVSPSFPHSPSFHSFWRFYLSLNLFTSTLPPRSHISVSLSFHHSLHLSRHPLPSLSLHPSLSNCAPSPWIPPISISSFCPSFLSSKLCVWIESSVCVDRELWCFVKHTNAQRGIHHSTQLEHQYTCFNCIFADPWQLRL